MVRWVVGSILRGVNPLSYFSFQPVLHDWCNKGSGMCYPVCRMMHIKEPSLLIGKSSPCGGSVFPLSLSEGSFTIYYTPYNRIKMCFVCGLLGVKYFWVFLFFFAKPHHDFLCKLGKLSYNQIVLKCNFLIAHSNYKESNSNEIILFFENNFS